MTPRPQNIINYTLQYIYDMISETIKPGVSVHFGAGILILERALRSGPCPGSRGLRPRCAPVAIVTKSIGLQRGDREDGDTAFTWCMASMTIGTGMGKCGKRFSLVNTTTRVRLREQYGQVREKELQYAPREKIIATLPDG